jgi:hypothetical protein
MPTAAAPWAPLGTVLERLGPGSGAFGSIRQVHANADDVRRVVVEHVV